MNGDDQWKWIEEFYTRLAQLPENRRPAWGSTGLAMQKIAPLLREILDAAQLVPYLSHAALCFQVYDRDMVIELYAEDLDKYRVRLYHKGTLAVFKEARVTEKEVLDTIKEFIKLG